MSKTANITKEIVQTSQNIKKIYKEFAGDLFNNKFYINLEYLLDSSIKVQFQQAWLYNPQKFCLSEYSIYELYPIILLVNKTNSIFEFKPDNLNQVIITPSLNSINKVLTLVA